MPAILHDSDLATGDERAANREQGQASPDAAGIEREADAVSSGKPRTISALGPAPGEYRSVTHGW